MRLHLALFILTLSLAGAAATPAELVWITVPSGFEGPARADPGNGAHIEAYVRHAAGREHGTLLQITTYDFGQKLAGVPTEELGNGAESYLLQFLGGVQRQRSVFHASQPTRTTLGGIPAARVEWTGVTQGEAMSGVMYCVIVGTTVVSFHTQGFSDAPPADRADAIRAIEAVRFRIGS